MFESPKCELKYKNGGEKMFLRINTLLNMSEKIEMDMFWQ